MIKRATPLFPKPQRDFAHPIGRICESVGAETDAATMADNLHVIVRLCRPHQRGAVCLTIHQPQPNWILMRYFGHIAIAFSSISPRPPFRNSVVAWEDTHSHLETGPIIDVTMLARALGIAPGIPLVMALL